MKLATDARIARRLRIGFGITLCLMIAIVITGITYPSRANPGFDRTVKVNNADIKTGNSARAASAGITYPIGRILIAQDGAVSEEVRKGINEIKAIQKKSIEAFEALENSREGKQLVAKLIEEHSGIIY